MKKNLFKATIGNFCVPRAMTLLAAVCVVSTLLWREPLALPVAEAHPAEANKLLPKLRGAVQARKQSRLTRKSVAPKRATYRRAAQRRRKVKKISRMQSVRLNQQWICPRLLVNRSVLWGKWLARYRFIDSELETVSSESNSEAVNSWQPELHALERALEEPSLEAPSYTDRATSEAQMDVELALGFTFPDEPAYREVVGVFQKSDFSHLRKSLEELKDPEFFAKSKPRPEPVLVRSKQPLKKKPAKKVAAQKKVAPVEPPVKRPVVATPEPTLAPVIEPPPETRPEPPLISDPPVLAAETPAPLTESAPLALSVPAAPANVAPALASFAVPVTSSLYPKALDVVPQARVFNSENTVSTHLEHSKRGLQQTHPYENTPFDTDVFGKILVSEALQEWLDRHQAHLELSLQPVGTADTQGFHYLTMRFPQEDFRAQAEGLKGRYHLVLEVRRPQDIDSPYAEIHYPEEINALTARTHIKFSADIKDFKVLAHPGYGERRLAQVLLTFFEGAAGEYERAKPVPHVQVQVLNFPEYDSLPPADDKGNLTIAAVPTHSQIVIKVQAPGYFPTYRTIPIFGGDVDVKIHLVSKAKVQALTRLAAIRQWDSFSVLMGRVFDEDRNLKAGEIVELEDQPAQNGLYFGLFSNPANRTTGTGFWSFFNVAPAFRYIVRPESNRRALRYFARPGSGYYFELGRGGIQSFQGRLVDPNAPKPPLATIRLVGDKAFETTSDDEGFFEIPGIDFPSGVITIEIDAPGYPLIWQTLPWHPRRTSHRQDIFLVQDRYVQESFMSSLQSNFGPNPQSREPMAGRGDLIAGAYGAMLKQVEGCLTPQLWSIEEAKPVSPEHGPFPFRGGLEDGEPLCLTKDRPGFNYLDLRPGEYLLKWQDDNKTLGSRVLHIGMGCKTIAVN